MVGGRKVVAMVQSRLTSSRLPGKAMLELNGKCLVQRALERAALAPCVDEVWLLTSTEPSDDPLAAKADALGYPVFRGELADCMARFLGAARASGAEVIARCTGDNPLTEPRLIELGAPRLVERGLDGLDFLDIPYGAHVYLFTASALEHAAAQPPAPRHREHVSTAFIEQPDIYKAERWRAPIPAIARPDVRVTLDELADYVWLSRVFRELERPGRPVALEDVIALWDATPPGRRPKHEVQP